MPDPTPTPDTPLQTDLLRMADNADANHMMPGWVSSGALRAAVRRAALAASPAPTDSRDGEMIESSRHAPTDSPEPGVRLLVREVLVRLADGRYSDRTTRAAREALAELDAELAAPTGTPDERPCICGPNSTGEAPDERPDCPVHRADVRCVCGHMRDLSHDADGECWRAPCRCDSFRPAAVTAPPADEVYSDPDLAGDHLLQPLIPNQPARWADFTDEQVATYRAAELAALTAAAPAVERATPDPDTLAALLDQAHEAHVGEPLGYLAAVAIARALIAAGITYTPTTPEQGHTAP